jgi:hypothetical protein
METVTSRDGTTLAYDRLGEGPPVVLVSGGSTDRMANAGLAAELAAHHTVYNFDRPFRPPWPPRLRRHPAVRHRA